MIERTGINLRRSTKRFWNIFIFRFFKRTFVSIIVRSRNHKGPWTVSWVKTSYDWESKHALRRKSHEFEWMILVLLSILNIPDVEPQLSVINFFKVCACWSLFIQILVKIDCSGRAPFEWRIPNAEWWSKLVEFENHHSMFSKTNLAQLLWKIPGCYYLNQEANRSF